ARARRAVRHAPGGRGPSAPAAPPRSCLARPHPERSCSVRARKRAAPAALFLKLIGGDLLSREVALRVPSALAGLTSLFGMGRGVSLPVRPPKVSKVQLGRVARTLKTP